MGRGELNAWCSLWGVMLWEEKIWLRGSRTPVSANLAATL